VQGVTDAERDAAWKRIQSAAKKHNVELNERDWRELSESAVAPDFGEGPRSVEKRTAPAQCCKARGEGSCDASQPPPRALTN
jgi:hypothetical protein